MRPQPWAFPQPLHLFRRFLRSSSHHRPQSQQQRGISSYLRDVLRTGTVNPPNPLIQALETNGSEGNYIPDLSLISPYHVESAVLKVLETSREKRAGLLDDIPESNTNDTLRILLQRIDKVEAKKKCLKQISTLLYHMADTIAEKRQWERAIDSLLRLEGISDDTDDASLLEPIYQAVNENVKIFKECNTTESFTSHTLLAGAASWLREQELQTGLHINDTTDRDEFLRLERGFQAIRPALQAKEGSRVNIANRLGDMYTFVGIRSRQAELSGYINFFEQQNHSIITAEEIQSMCQTVTEHMKPLLPTTDTRQLIDSFLSPKQQQSPSPEVQDRRAMIRLQEHVTLDGSLFYLSRLLQDIFGVSLVEDEEAKRFAWNADVRLFHVVEYDPESSGEPKRLGSFFLDAYERTGKLERPATMPLFPRDNSTESPPVVVLSLSLEPPAWSDESAPMTWDDVESLFHELGHVLQLLLAQTKTTSIESPGLGTLLGPDRVQLGLSEFLPKVSTYASRIRLATLFYSATSYECSFLRFASDQSSWSTG